MTTIEHEAAAIESMKLEAEIGRLRAENNRLREANADLVKALTETTPPIPPEAFT